MDGYDLFRKLSSGAKFDFKRFRSDAEKLHIIRPSKPIVEERRKNNQDEKKTNKKKMSKTSVNEKDDDADDDDSDEGEDSEDTSKTGQKLVTNAKQDRSDDDEEEEEDNDSDDDVDDEESDNADDDEEDNNDDDEDDNNDETKSSDSDSENELHILGEIKSRGEDDDRNKKKEERKKRKLARKKSDQLQADLKQEQINHIRRKNRLHVHGTDIPDPVESFESLQTQYNIHNHIIKNIETVGYKQPTPIQLQAIPVMLNNRDILACAPTGSGKTAAFIVPILHHLKEPRNEGVRALILAPTRELAKQTFSEFQRLSENMGFRLVYVDKVGKDLKKLKRTFKKSDIMVSTPNRLVYLLEQTPPLLSLSSVIWLVVDESDKLFEDGKTGFRDQLATIYKACDGTVRRAMFSATFTSEVEQWCKLNLDNVVQVYVGAKNTATKTVEQSLLFCGSEQGKLLAIRALIKKGIEPPVLVFVQSKDRAKDLFHELIYDGMNVDVIHSERTQTQRDNVVKCFRSGKIWILICTELMGRGIDFKGVNLVINYDFPNSAISYIHRIGRTGRAGRPGKAVTFFTENDAIFLRSIAGVMKAAGCPVPDYMLKMNKPSRQTKKKLAKSAIARDGIATEPKYAVKNRIRAFKRKSREGKNVKSHKKKRSSDWQKPVNLKPWNKNKRKSENTSESSEPKKQKTDSGNVSGKDGQKRSDSHKHFNKQKHFKGQKSSKGSFKGNKEKTKNMT